MGPRKTFLRSCTAFVAIAALALAACGDDDDDADEAGTASGATDTTAAATDTTAAATDTTGEGTADTGAGDTASTSGGGGGGGASTLPPIEGQIEPQDIATTPELGGTGEDLLGPVGSGLTRGVGDDEVRFGCVTQSAYYPGVAEGVRAVFERVNGDGGVHGRTLSISDCGDDNSDPDTNLTLVQEQVERDEVFGVVDVSVMLLPASSDFLNESETPYWGWGAPPGLCGNRWGFGANGCLIGPYLPDSVPTPYANSTLVDPAIIATGLEPSEVRAAFIAGDDDAGRGGNALYASLFAQRGAEVVYDQATVPVDVAVADYSPYVQAILEADPNLVYISTRFADVPPITAGLRDAGFEGPIVNFVAYQPGLLESSPDTASQLEGALINSQFPVQEEQSEFILRMEADLEAAGEETVIQLGTVIGYTIGEQIVQMLDAVGPELDTQTFDETVNGGDFVFRPGYGDGDGDMAFPAGHFVPSPCASLVNVSDGAYGVELPFDCYALFPGA